MQITQQLLKELRPLFFSDITPHYIPCTQLTAEFHQEINIYMYPDTYIEYDYDKLDNLYFLPHQVLFFLIHEVELLNSIYELLVASTIFNEEKSEVI